MKTRIDRDAKRAQYHFDNVASLAAYIENTPRTWPSRDAESIAPEMSWDLGVGYNGAFELAKRGWVEGAKKAQDALKAFPTKTPEPDTRVDFYGFRPHVPRFCAGAPDHMIRHATKAETGAGRVLTLVVPIGASAASQAHAMANFGVAVTQYINQLEQAGTRVELIGADICNIRGWRMSHTFTVKKAHQPIDLAAIAFVIGHTSMFRRIALAARERGAAPYQMGYGMSDNGKLTDIIDPAPGTVILNGMRDATSNAQTPEKALAYVTRQIEAALKAMEL